MIADTEQDVPDAPMLSSPLTVEVTPISLAVFDELRCGEGAAA
jgi:hypothetical protein